jgi:4a-hydroxytetrahydrobiopterin dehydratase
VAQGGCFFNNESMKNKKLLKDKANFHRLKNDEIQAKGKQLSCWRVIKRHHLFRSYSFPDFKKALGFVNKVGKIAESLQHHPDVALSYGKVDLKTFDHKTNGLIPLDFILADRIEKIFKKSH